MFANVFVALLSLGDPTTSQLSEAWKLNTWYLLTTRACQQASNHGPVVCKGLCCVALDKICSQGCHQYTPMTSVGVKLCY